jgi:hypothetical protein
VEEERNEVRDWAEDVIEVEADDDEDRDQRQAIAIIGSLMGLALIEQARRERQAGASVAEPVEPLEPVTGPSAFSFSEVPSRPAAIERLAMATPWGDAADPEPVLVPTPAPTVAPVPLATPSPTLRIPPPPPMAEDVTDLLGGGGTGVTGY